MEHLGFYIFGLGLLNLYEHVGQMYTLDPWLGQSASAVYYHVAIAWVSK